MDMFLTYGSCSRFLSREMLAQSRVTKTVRSSFPGEQKLQTFPLICHPSEIHRYDTCLADGHFRFGSISEDGHGSTMYDS